MAVYNYDRFSLECGLVLLDGPDVGDTAPDFTAPTLNGDEFCLSEFEDYTVVLESGSMTCPVYASKIDRMNSLQEKFPDVVFVVLYVREIHPGENRGPHVSADDKMGCARRTRHILGENRRIVVDDLEGSIHSEYGHLPNFVYVIDSDRTVRYRSEWNTPEAVEAVLSDPSLSGYDKKKSDLPDTYPQIGKNFLHVLRFGGVKALNDILLKSPPDP